MSLDVAQERQQAHAYLDKLTPAQLSAVRTLLETMLPDPVSICLANAPIEDEEISEEEEQSVERSKEWFKRHQGSSLEDVVGELGFNMDRIRYGESGSRQSASLTKPRPIYAPSHNTSP